MTEKALQTLEAKTSDAKEILEESLDFMKSILPHLRKMGEDLYPDGIPFTSDDEIIEPPFE